MRVYSIATLLIFMGVWALLMVSFTNPWYYYREDFIAKDDGLVYRNYQVNFYPTKAKVISGNLTMINGDENYSYKELIQTRFWKSSISLGFTRFIKTSIAFSVLGFALATALIVLTFFDMYGSEKRWLGIVGKALGFSIFAFTLISFTTYIIFKKELHNDCTAVHPTDFTNFCNTYGTQYTKTNTSLGFFNEKFIGHADLSKWGPSSGFNCVIIASAISLAGAIYNVIFFNK